MSDSVIITCDSCPYQKQNRNHAEYLLTALYFESLKHEAWEDEALEADSFHFDPSLVKAVDAKGGHKKRGGNNSALSESHTHALSRLLNQGENRETLDAYKSAVLDGLAIKACK